MSQNEAYALLIGVDDYSAYDASAGHAKGTSDLLGSRNDVLAFFRTCRDLDIPAAQIRVLTSPKLDLALLPGVPAENVGVATEEAIKEGARWLSEALRDGRGTGLLSFSGHGDKLDRGELAICPADTRGPALAGAIRFEELRGVFAEAGALGNLTCVIDACFAGAALDPSAPRERRTLSLTGRAATEPATAGALDLGDRLIAAARPDQAAFQARFSGEHRGAFSWAVGATLDQWTSVKDADGTRKSLSYGELVTRAGRLLETLSFAQEPVLAGPENVGDLAFLQRGSSPLSTSAEPDAARAPLQIDPGFLTFRKVVLTLEMVPPVVLAEVFAIHTTTGSYTAGNEYWNVNKDAVANLGGEAIAISYTDYSTGTPSPTAFAHAQSFVEPIGLTWANIGRTDPISGGYLFKNGTTYLRLRKNTASPPSLTYVTWYQVLPNGTSAANISPSGTFATASSLSFPRDTTGWDIDYAI